MSANAKNIHIFLVVPVNTCVPHDIIPTGQERIMTRLYVQYCLLIPDIHSEKHKRSFILAAYTEWSSEISLRLRGN